PHSTVPSTPPSPPVIYTLSLHDALPIFHFQPAITLIDSILSPTSVAELRRRNQGLGDLRDLEVGCHAYLRPGNEQHKKGEWRVRSEEHTSELQSPYDLVCRLLLEKKKK